MSHIAFKNIIFSHGTSPFFKTGAGLFVLGQIIGLLAMFGTSREAFAIGPVVIFSIAFAYIIPVMICVGVGKIFFGAQAQDITKVVQGYSYIRMVLIISMIFVFIGLAGAVMLMFAFLQSGVALIASAVIAGLTFIQYRLYFAAYFSFYNDLNFSIHTGKAPIFLRGLNSFTIWGIIITIPGLFSTFLIFAAASLSVISNLTAAVGYILMYLSLRQLDTAVRDGNYYAARDAASNALDSNSLNPNSSDSDDDIFDID